MQLKNITNTLALTGRKQMESNGSTQELWNIMERDGKLWIALDSYSMLWPARSFQMAGTKKNEDLTEILSLIMFGCQRIKENS